MRKSALPCFSARSSQLWHGICHLRPLQRFVHAVWGDITWRRIWSSSYWRKQIARSAEIERSRPTDRIRGWCLWGVGGDYARVGWRPSRGKRVWCGGGAWNGSRYFLAAGSLDLWFLRRKRPKYVWFCTEFRMRHASRIKYWASYLRTENK